MGKREDKKREAEAKKLAPLVKEFCSKVGKEIKGCGAFQGEYVLETKGGTLKVSVSSFDATIFCRFDDPEKAGKLGLVFMNPYSGKWNWHGNEAGTIFEEWRKAVTRILA